MSIREDHELIRSGPYRFIRHPIYSGLLLAVAGTGLLLAELRALLAILLILAAFICKARKEEKLLSCEFGERFQVHVHHAGMFLPRLRSIFNS